MALVTNKPDFFSRFVEDIPVRVPLPPGSRAPPEGPPSDKDMGKDDLSGSEYVNAETNTIPPGHEDRVKYLQNILLLSQKYLDIWGGINTREQIDKGKLPEDMSNESQMKRSDYRIKVYKTLLDSSAMGWFATSSEETVRKHFEIEISKFHLVLVNAIVDGIVTATGMTAGLEKVLTSITTMAKDVKASLRMVTFRVTADLVYVTTGKSTMQQVKMDIIFFQKEVSLIESEWDYYKPKLEEWLHEMGDKSIRDPTDGVEIPVD